MMPIALPVAVGACVVIIAMGGGVAFRLLRHEQRLDARIRALHVRPPECASAPSPPTAARARDCRATMVRLLSGVGQWVLRSRMLSAQMLDDFERAWRAAGLRGTARCACSSAARSSPCWRCRC